LLSTESLSGTFLNSNCFHSISLVRRRKTAFLESSSLSAISRAQTNGSASNIAYSYVEMFGCNDLPGLSSSSSVIFPAAYVKYNRSMVDNTTTSWR
jgi:hypothetical protein